MKNIKLLSTLSLSILLTFCGGKTDKEIFDNALELANNKKYDEAVVIFEQLADDYQKSELAPKALFECAKMYQGKVIKSLEAEESLKKSVDFYKKINKLYPNSAEAEKSLFMAGFILANELEDFDNARTTYQQFLEKYPEGDLSDDAKIELENLGKSPEEILMQKVKE